MSRTVLARVRDWLGALTADESPGDEGGDTDSKSGDENVDPDEDEGFVRSRLDASVLFAHGTRSRPVDAAIDDVAEQAEQLEAADVEHDPHER